MHDGPLRTTDRLRGRHIVVMSRCSWTLFNFRRSLVGALHTAGASVLALGAAGDGFDAQLRAAGIEFQHIPVSRRSLNPLGDALLFVSLVATFRRVRPTLVHAFTIKPAVFGTLAAAAAGVPVRVVTITGLGHAFISGSTLLRRVVIALYRLALRRAHRVFFQNADDRALFIGLGLVPAERSELIAGSGVDLEHFAVAPLPYRAGTAPSFLMIARLLKEKGVREYLQAASALKAAHPQATFRLLGGVDPRNPSALSPDEVAALRASTSVEWIDEVADVRPYIRAADVVVLPSYREGLPRTLLEASAMGRALIATDVEGCREVVVDSQNGYVVPAGDAQALAGAMGRMIEDPAAIATMGANARVRAGARFDERQVLSRTLAAYEELLGCRAAKVE
jgi:glycosyltransferase involved in cell wall biosynthesis